MTEAAARAALAAFYAVGGIERWIAAQPWMAVPGGWAVLEPFEGLRFRVEIVAGGVRVVMSARGASRRRGSCRGTAGG